MEGRPLELRAGGKRLEERSLERQWSLPCITLASYVAFAPLTVLCALHWSCAALMWASGLTTALLESVLVVERRLEPFTDQRMAAASGCRLIARDMLQGIRVISTTVLPILLASFQGASFVVTATWTHRTATNCSVVDLPRLAEAGFTSFACRDGYVAVDLQLGVPAWSSQRDEELGHVVRERKAMDAPPRGLWLKTQLGRIALTAESHDGRLGFAAPIFRSLAARENGERPVAWAVKAGSPVKRSVCDDNLGLPGTCGFFARRLQEHWERFLLAPDWFGQSWGFNITRFSESEMRQAVAEAEQRYPFSHLKGPDPPTFVVAEGPRQYFGTAVCCLWVLYTLLAVGLVDRVVEVLDTPPVIEEPAATREYSKMMALEEATLRERPEAARGFLGDLADFWNDPLNTRQVHAITDELTSLPSGRGSHRGPPSGRSHSARSGRVAPVARW